MDFKCKWHYSTTIVGDFIMASFKLTGTYEKYEPKELSISVNGNIRKITFDSVVDDSLVVLDESPSLSSNELMQTGTTIYNIPMGKALFDSVTEDYGKGIATAEIDVICSDLYDIDGNMIKDWSAGETYDIGDIVRVDKDKLGNSIWNYKDGSPMYWQVVSRNFKKTGVPVVSLGLRECKYSVTPPLTSVSFAEDSWDTIAKICQNYKAEEYYNIGDEKTITLSNGNQVTLQIWGFNHDNLTSGGKANITIGMKHLLASKYQMNTTTTNSGGWENCYFRTTTLPQIFTTLPTDLQSVIKMVDKVCSVGGSSTGTKLISDNLFLFSECEVYGSRYYTMAVEGSWYKYWQNIRPDLYPNKSAKVLNNGKGSSSYWWLRSPSDNASALSSYGISINTNFSGAGGSSIGYVSAGADTQYGICLGFCI